ncbi:2-dehydropantoate 2-reductase [Ferrovibrio sp.]|uniref:ketopantoate reductase family protein n=1 Tax=Ferrovibrio sp. TaxID=1917215 RepID=UPI0025BFBA42|nr:2-dehydropantoate 2-reductase [Ferrovibrio sp.]MBX3454228.1 2-dehydropantoate 2-reductase [Ferrovibrio sp.]
MKIAIVGAGAIGGYFGGVLARSGAEVSLLARGPHLQAIQARGLRIQTADGEDFTVHPKASDDPAALGRQDVLIISVKAPALPALAPQLAPMLGPDTAIVTAMNGIPYWYFHAYAGPVAGRHLKAVDPDGAIWRALPPERVIGGVVRLPSSVPEPGVIRGLTRANLALGEPDGTQSPRLASISQALMAAGINAPMRSDIRHDIWVKLLGNMAFSPCSVLTGGTQAQVAADPAMRAVLTALMREGQSVGEGLGIRFEVSVEQRVTEGGGVALHKPSMLQDWEAGRPMEIESIIGAVAELAAMQGIATPTIAIVLALLRRKAALQQA